MDELKVSPKIKGAKTQVKLQTRTCSLYLHRVALKGEVLNLFLAPRLGNEKRLFFHFSRLTSLINKMNQKNNTDKDKTKSIARMIFVGVLTLTLIAGGLVYLIPGQVAFAQTSWNDSLKKNLTTEARIFRTRISDTKNTESFSLTAVSNPQSPKAGEVATLNAEVKNNKGSLSNLIVDIEIYNSNQEQVYQEFFENQNFNQGETKHFNVNWTPQEEGEFAVDMGIFSENWSETLFWKDEVLNVSVQPDNPEEDEGSIFSFTASSNPNSPSVGEIAEINTEIQNNAGNANNLIVDIEIYNSNGQQVFQEFFEWQNFNHEEIKTYNTIWTPQNEGDYVVDIGIFSENWSQVLFWKDEVTNISVEQNQTDPPGDEEDEENDDNSEEDNNDSDNPLSGITFYVNPNSNAQQQANEWMDSNPENAALMEILAAQPESRWFGDWNADIESDVQNSVQEMNAQGSTPVFVAYNIPLRDCGSYSAGGANTPDGYKQWIDSFANGLGNDRAVIILEPDALAGMDCLSSEDQQIRMNLVKYATDKFKSLSDVFVYIDAGHSNWHSAEEIAGRLQNAGINTADGFALNTSNFHTTESNISYGTEVSNILGEKRFVIDTSRNGLGAPDNGEWCNPPGRALGQTPTTNTGNSLVDAFLWVKMPGESDGNCNGGPNAGHWWPEYALELIQNSYLAN